MKIIITERQLELIKQDLSFEQIYKDFYPQIFRNVCMRYADKDRELAQDYCQLGFIKVYQKLPTFDGRSLNSWVNSVVKNTIIDEIRKVKMKKTNDFDFSRYDASEEDYDDSFMGKYSEQDIQDAIKSLPKKQEEIFRLYYFEDLQHNEIANKLNISDGTSKSQLFKAKAGVKEFLEKIK